MENVSSLMVFVLQRMDGARVVVGGVCLQRTDGAGVVIACYGCTQGGWRVLSLVVSVVTGPSGALLAVANVV